MIDQVSIGDIAVKIAEYRDFKVTHEEIIGWSRAAMMAAHIPPHEVPHVMDLLQDISCSTPETMRRAVEEHEKLLSRVYNEDGRLHFGK
ncbi:MAG: hypothetical protein CMO80_22990 [Verrucomicrobiales bacterium]|nr:hypothetical protein [Verrucomicrobiales bacterium]|tara:strand:- start:3265 stop:3531 length:267 start_codon:yes stop_codon:yes gene_type:complete